MDIIDQLAEQHIKAAIERGELSGLSGEGRPLPDEDLSMVPEHLRAGYRLLKNAGYLPPELETLRAIKDTEALLARIHEPEARERKLRHLRLLELRLQESRGHGLGQVVQQQYQDRLSQALAPDTDSD
ncbi:DUF1992 domain-containing protein [Thiorhodococcus mannitoliphagus]|uniref:DUF1992 domain-containing protein n=1 Tax=Thiorhodococcus mannitoliphagus TaxID=329406 RepID=A0A6P1DU86_9GAMM|nr:DnaJ family domain-containing protein [Thiorhodococcus mannitoliphagus]NEX20531.1 DUF1992 domain-containing protein [Thiorhodococcus mannitoliphagus]